MEAPLEPCNGSWISVGLAAVGGAGAMRFGDGDGGDGAPMSEPPDEPAAPSRSRLAIYYGCLGVFTAVALSIVIAAAAGKHAEPELAGGYDVSAGASCLGAKFDLAQSGRFVSIGNPAGTTAGNLTLAHDRLSGRIECVGRRSAALVATFAGGVLHGTIGGQPMDAVLKRDRLHRGRPSSRSPARSPGPTGWHRASNCLGSSIVLAGAGRRYRAHHRPSAGHGELPGRRRAWGDRL